jgi:hypothetical protein
MIISWQELAEAFQLSEAGSSGLIIEVHELLKEEKEAFIH